MASRAGCDLHGGAELIAETRRARSARIRRSGREFSRRAIDITFSMIWRTRSPLVRTISVSRLSSADSDGGFAEQLRGVAHGAHRVADLVRDAGRQPAEPGELGLLDLGRQQFGVFEEHDDRRGLRAAERREMRLDHVAAVGRDEGLRWAAGIARRAAARSRVDRAAAATLRRAARPDRRCDRRAACAADSLMSRMRFSWSTTTMLSRRFCTMYCDSCARLARSTCWRRTVASVSRRRRAIGQASSATRNTMPPRMPAAG